MGVNMMKFTKSQIALSVALSLMGSTAMAEESSTAKDVAQDDIEVIAVSGVRLSLKEAIATKRGSDNILDSIAAEDMGKFPDTNLAESLQRITGVSVSRNNGEGSQITVRGFGPSFNLITLNGRQMPGTGNSRSFNFENL